MTSTPHVMNWPALLSSKRFKTVDGAVRPTRTPATNEGAPGLRSDFHIDHDRVNVAAGRDGLVPVQVVIAAQRLAVADDVP